MTRLVLAFALAMLFAPSQAAAQELFVDLRTNYSSSEFGWVRVVVIDRADERRTWTSLQSARGDFLAGARVAELESVTRGDYVLSVELLDGLMRTVHGRVWLLAMPGERFATTLLIVEP
jgi:hypothetical protein